jgi:hypothetical protein
MKISIARNNQSFGPYDLEEVNSYLLSGHLKKDDLAWHDGLPQWVPLHQIAGVRLPEFRTPPPPPGSSPPVQAIAGERPRVHIPASVAQVEKPAPKFDQKGAAIACGAVICLFGFLAFVSSQSSPTAQSPRSGSNLASIGAPQAPLPTSKPTAKPTPTSTPTRAERRRLAAEKRRQEREQARQQREAQRQAAAAAEQAAQAERQKRIDERVKNNSWDGAVPAVVDYLKNTLNDFNSAEWMEWGQTVKTDSGGYMVRLKYRAKNAFGGLIIKHQVFTMDSEGNVTGVLDWE